MSNLKLLRSSVWSITVMLASASPAFQRDNIQDRQVALCANDCGQGWCCFLYTDCVKSSVGDPYVCIDQLLTNADGTFMTSPAYNLGSFNSLVASENSQLQTWSLTIPTSISFPLSNPRPTTFPIPTSTPTPPPALANPTTATTNSALQSSQITAGPSVSSVPSRTSSAGSSSISPKDSSTSVAGSSARAVTSASGVTTAAAPSSTSNSGASGAGNMLGGISGGFLVTILIITLGIAV